MPVSEAPATIIAAHAVSVIRGRARLLDQVSLSLHGRERVALLGPNGAGKSTLLRVMAGDLPASSGRVDCLGRPLSAWPSQELARRRAVLSQQQYVPFAYRAEQLVAMGRFPHTQGSLGVEDWEIVQQAMQLTASRHLAGRGIDTLSGGELARVHAARVLSQLWHCSSETPGLLLLDEPTAALDLRYQVELLERVAEFARDRGIATLAVLHDVNQAARWADRIVYLRQGRLVAAGSPEQMISSDWLRQVYEVEALILNPPPDGRPHVVLGCALPGCASREPRTERAS